MNNNRIKYYTKCFQKVLEGIEKSSFLGNKKTKGFLEGGKYFTLTDEHAETFEKLLKSILNEQKWSHKFSEKFIENKLRKMIAELLNENSSSVIENKVVELFNELDRFNDEYTVLIPLEGIELSVDEIELGRIKIINGTEKFVDELLNDIKKIVVSTKQSETLKEQQNEYIKAQLIGVYSNRTCSLVKIVAEPIAAKEKALEYTRSVIDILRFSLPQFTRDVSKMNFGIYGDIIKTERIIPLIKTNKQSFTSDEEVIGPLFSYKIDNSAIDKLKESKIYNLFNYVKKDEKERTDFQNTILRSIHWYASHITQYENENKLLNLITSIEALLTPKDNNPIGTALAEGVALIVGETFEKRKKIKTKILQLWRLRCSISHGGKKYVLEKEVEELSLLVFFTIIILLDYLNEFKTQKELLDWIEEKKLSTAS